MISLDIDILKTFGSNYIDKLKNVVFDGTYAWASESHILIRAECDDEKNDPYEMSERFPSLINELPPHDSELWTKEIPTGEIKTQKCSECGGTGKSYKCPECGGDGVVHLDHDWTDTNGKSRYSDYEVECGNCNGRSVVRGGDKPCEECNGTGTLDLDSPIQFGNAYIDAKLLKALSVLPNLELHPNPKNNPYRQIPIRGNGFVGVVMPTRGP